MSEFDPTAAGFDAIFKAIAASRALPEIYAAAHGDAHQYSFTSADEVRRIAELLGIGPAHAFLDLACGMGGPPHAARPLRITPFH